MELNRPVLVAVQGSIFVCESKYKEYDCVHEFISCANTSVCTGTLRTTTSVCTLCGHAGLLFVL